MTPKGASEITKNVFQDSTARRSRSSDRKRARDRHRPLTSRKPARLREDCEPRTARAAGGSLKHTSSRERDDLRGKMAARSMPRFSCPLYSPPSPDKHLPAQPTRPSHAPTSPEGGLARSCPPARPRRVPYVPFCRLSKSSRMMRLVAILTSRMKECTGSCGRRAPR